MNCKVLQYINRHKWRGIKPHCESIMLFLLLMAVSSINAQNIFDFNWNTGSAEFGINYSAENNDTIEIGLSIVNLIAEHQSTNLGIEYSPVKYWRLYKFQNEPETISGGEKFSFINANIFLNLLRNDMFILGPFTSINYMYINTVSGINWSEYIFGSGLRFSFRVKIDKIHYSLQVNTEIGYRSITGNNKFYFSISGDMLPALIGLGVALAVTEQEHAQKIRR